MVRYGKWMAAAAVAAGLAAATGAQANVIYLDVGAMDHARTVNIAGIGNVYDAPMQFTAHDNGVVKHLLAWCVDVYHEITVKDYVPDLAYTDTGALSTDFAGHALDAGDALKIGLLANYGQDIFDTLPTAPPAFTAPEPKRSQFPAGAAGTAQYNAAHLAWVTAKNQHTAAVTAYNAAVSLRFTTLSAVQGAIWQIASNRDVTSTNHDAAFDLLVDHLSGNHLTDYFTGGFGGEGHAVTVLNPVQLYGGKTGHTPLKLTQSFVVAQVPEPATWLLMIGGFGLAGAELRRRRREAAAAA